MSLERYEFNDQIGESFPIDLDKCDMSALFEWWEKVKSLGAEYCAIETEKDYDSWGVDAINAVAYKKRLEDEQKWKDRVAAYEKSCEYDRQKKIEHERQTYLRLKKKFES